MSEQKPIRLEDLTTTAGPRGGVKPFGAIDRTQIEVGARPEPLERQGSFPPPGA